MASPAFFGSRSPILPADAPAVVCEGRYRVEAGGAVRLGFPGVTVHMRFRGRGAALRAWSATADACFDVTVDGGPPALLRLAPGEGTYPLAHGLADDTEHTLRLARRTESWQGVCALREFALADGGGWLPPPVLPARRLLFVGDSVTSGEMAGWQPGAPAPFPAANNNAQCAYGRLLAQRLEAQCHLASYGGRGIVRDWQGIRDTINAPQYYELALPDEPAARWDHRRYVPEAVGIQLGTNDFNRGIPDEDEFASGYVGLIRKIRRDAPHAWIVAMDSPIVTDLDGEPRRTALGRYLDQVVRETGDARVVRAGLRHYPGVPGNGHPGQAEHRAMADELEPVFRRILGG